ncbi:MAG: NAD-dependent epimerase/dehydratase family protein, partial [Nitrospirota bacterium]|nr:NAD-dependent epimerase/dehydratase family protein [Nitrospirota bacterium]
MDTSDKILVTGSAGFMGSHIVDALIKAGYTEVYGVDDLSGGSLENVSAEAIKGFMQADISERFVAEDIV